MSPACLICADINMCRIKCDVSFSWYACTPTLPNRRFLSSPFCLTAALLKQNPNLSGQDLQVQTCEGGRIRNVFFYTSCFGFHRSVLPFPRGGFASSAQHRADDRSEAAGPASAISAAELQGRGRLYRARPAAAHTKLPLPPRRGPGLCPAEPPGRPPPPAARPPSPASGRLPPRRAAAAGRAARGGAGPGFGGEAGPGGAAAGSRPGVRCGGGQSSGPAAGEELPGLRRRLAPGGSACPRCAALTPGSQSDPRLPGARPPARGGAAV